MQIRIVLSWGANPPDLDVHLLSPTGAPSPASPCCLRVFSRKPLQPFPSGPFGSGVSSECFGCAGCKIWYGNLRCTARENVQLDTDAQNGYGPETITFNSVAPGKYRFQVHKFSAGSPVAMKDSQGVVQERRSGLLVAPPHAHTRAHAQSYSTHTHSPLGPARALCPTRSVH